MAGWLCVFDLLETPITLVTFSECSGGFSFPGKCVHRYFRAGETELPPDSHLLAKKRTATVHREVHQSPVSVTRSFAFSNSANDQAMSGPRLGGPAWGQVSGFFHDDKALRGLNMKRHLIFSPRCSSSKP